MNSPQTMPTLGELSRATRITMTAALELYASEQWHDAGVAAMSAFDALSGQLLDSEQMTRDSRVAAAETAAETLADLINLDQDIPMPETAMVQLVDAYEVLTG